MDFRLKWRGKYLPVLTEQRDIFKVEVMINAYNFYVQMISGRSLSRYFYI